MSHRNFENRIPAMAAGRYLERLSKALPGAKSWSGRNREFWPDGAKLVMSISLEFEAGSQPEQGSSSPAPLLDGYRDLATAKWYEYGFKEGIPRLLDVFHRRRVHVTSHMAGAAVNRNPELAKEIVERGHEAAVRGSNWPPSHSLSPEEERASCEAGIRSVMRATSTRPLGFHAPWLRRTSHTLSILQDLGFLYHVDDVSRDEPFVVTANASPFAVVPYAVGMNDLVNYELRNFSSEQYASELRNEFEMLYSEADNRRRMMSISAHDRISGRPARAKVLEEFIIYAQRRPGVVFLRKDEIARFALASAITPREEEERERAADAA